MIVTIVMIVTVVMIFFAERYYLLVGFRINK